MTLDGVGFAELVAGPFGGEHPIDLRPFGVAALFPGGDLRGDLVFAVDAAVEALSAEDTDLNLDHIQPAGMFRSVVNLEASEHPAAFGCGKSVVDCARRMGGKIVHDHADHRGIREIDVHEFAHTVGKVLIGASICDLDPPPRTVGIKKNEEIDGAITAVLVIVAFKLAGLCRNRVANLTNQLGRALVEANNGPQRIGFFGIKIQHILHPGNIFAIDLWDAPHVLAPGIAQPDVWKLTGA